MIRRLTIDLEGDDEDVLVTLRDEGEHKASQRCSGWPAAVDAVRDLLDACEADEEGERYTMTDESSATTLAVALHKAGPESLSVSDCEIVAFTIKATGPLSFEILGHPRDPNIGPMRMIGDYDSPDDALHYLRVVAGNEWKHYVAVPADKDTVN
jgi:hypothetical protein